MATHSSILVWKSESSVVSDSLRPTGLYSPWNSPGQNTGVGSRSLLQGIFPTLGSNPRRLYLLRYRQALCYLSHEGSLKISINQETYCYSSFDFSG